MNNSADFSYYDAAAKAIAWSNDGKNGILLATGSAHTLIVWKPTYQRLYVDLDNDAPLSCLAFSNSGLLASAAGREIKIRKTGGTWDEILRIQETSNVTAIDFCCYHEMNTCKRPLLAYGTADGSVTVVDINSRNEVKTTAQSKINSVKWFGFPHTSLVAAADGTVIELELDGDKLQKTRERKAVKARKSSTLLAVPYQPHSANDENAGVPCPSILKNDHKVGLFKNCRMDSISIGRSFLAVAKRKIEYALADEGPIATAESGENIEALSWIGDSPLNFATGHRGEIVLWSIKIRHRAELLNQLINWLKPDTISSVEIESVASIEAHRDTVTAIAYPPIRRSWEHSAKNRWLMASASEDETVKLWDISSIQESRSDYEMRRFSACVGITACVEIGAFNGVSRHDISIRPKDLLKKTFRGLAARRIKQP
jgi:WD40 repeat protein